MSSLKSTEEKPSLAEFEIGFDWWVLFCGYMGIDVVFQGYLMMVFE
jgi:hypothetical protein